MDGTGSESCLMVGIGISSVETLSSATTVLVKHDQIRSWQE